MQSRDVTILLVVILVLAGATFFFTETPTGRAIAGFTASVEVKPYYVDEINRSQNSTPATWGSDVQIAMNITYFGIGSSNLNIVKPENFTNGFDWFVNESGTIKTVADSGSNISWNANLSTGSAVLYFTVPAPTITTFFEQISLTSYNKSVLVSSDNSFLGVAANVTVNTNFSDYILYLIDDGATDVTSVYGLTIANGVASWSNFNLSNKTFELIGTRESPVTTVTVTTSGGGGGGGGGGGFLGTAVCAECTVACPDGSWIKPGYSCPELVEGEVLDSEVPFRVFPFNFDLLLREERTHTFSVNVSNSLDVPRKVSITSSNLVFSPNVESVALLPGERRSVGITISGEAGFHEGVITFTSSGFDESVRLAVEIFSTPEQESPAPVSIGDPVVIPGRDLKELFVLLGVLGLILFVLFFWKD